MLQKNKWRLARIRTSGPEYYICPLYPLSYISNTFVLLYNHYHYYGINVSLLNIPVSPIYINALVLYNGKSLPTFVNLSIILILFAFDMLLTHFDNYNLKVKECKSRKNQ